MNIIGSPYNHEHTAFSEKTSALLAMAFNNDYVVLPFSGNIFDGDSLRRKTVVSCDCYDSEESFLFVPEGIKVNPNLLKDRKVFSIINGVFIIVAPRAESSQLGALYEELSMERKARLAFVVREEGRTTNIFINNPDVEVPEVYLQGFYSIVLESVILGESKNYHYAHGFAKSVRFNSDDGRKMIRKHNYLNGKRSIRDHASNCIIDPETELATSCLINKEGKLNDFKLYSAVSTLDSENRLLHLKYCKNGKLENPLEQLPAFQANYPSGMTRAFAFVTDNTLYNLDGDAFASYAEDGGLQFRVVRNDEESYLVNEEGVFFEGEIDFTWSRLSFSVSFEGDVFFEHTV